MMMLKGFIFFAKNKNSFDKVIDKINKLLYT